MLERVPQQPAADQVVPDARPKEERYADSASHVARGPEVSPSGARAPGLTAVVGSAAGLAALAIFNNWQARQAERENGPIGNFMTVDGVRLHYVDKGEGRPVVLLHGNGSLIQDFGFSILERLARDHRVIVFDRPGYGFSERPKDIVWDPYAQASLFEHALDQLQVRTPVVLGHSWGAAVALTLAMTAPQRIAGAVLVSGYYFATRRLDAAMASINALPMVGPVARNTISPLMGWVLGKPMVRVMFSPNPVPDSFSDFPAALALRPSQLRASGEEAATLRRWALRASRHYAQTRAPVTIMVGEDDRIADFQWHSVRLHQAIPHSRLLVYPRTGHMLHHVHPDEVIAAIDGVADQQSDA